MLTRDHDSISWYFLDNAHAAGGGTNAVNVILVDFRGFDTFGEITVLGIAAVGVLALLDGLRVRRPSTDPDGRAWSFARGAADAAHGGAPAAAPRAGGQRLHLLARPQPAGRRLHRRAGHGRRAGAAVHGRWARTRAEACCTAGGRRYTRWIGAGLGIAGLTGVGAFVLRRAVPDQRARPPAGALARRPAARERGAVRPGRLHHRRRRDDADALGARVRPAANAGGTRT